jgi:hypothetical protein
MRDQSLPLEKVQTIPGERIALWAGALRLDWLLSKKPFLVDHAEFAY